MSGWHPLNPRLLPCILLRLILIRESGSLENERPARSETRHGWLTKDLLDGNTIRELSSLLVLMQGRTVTAKMWGLEYAEHRQAVDVGCS